MTTEIEKPDSHASDTENRSGTRLFVEILCVALLLLLLGFGYGIYRAGSVGRAVPYLMGQRFFVPETSIKLGSVPVGTDVKGTIGLMNRSSAPVKILGARKSCGCISLDPFPFEVPPHAERQLQLKLRAPDSPSEFAHTVELYVDDNHFTSFPIVLSGASVDK